MALAWGLDSASAPSEYSMGKHTANYNIRLGLVAGVVSACDALADFIKRAVCALGSSLTAVVELVLWATQGVFHAFHRWVSYACWFIVNLANWYDSTSEKSRGRFEANLRH
jgi:hypothetical protein